MKNLNLLVLSLSSIILFASCDKLEDIFGTEKNPDVPQIEINTTEAQFSADGGNNSIVFSATENWTAEILNSRADGWCSIYPTSGPAGNATITITTMANDTPDDRNASIVIKAGIVSETINVFQKQKDALTVTSSKFEVGPEGGEVVIEVKANIDFNYKLDTVAEKWIEFVATRAITTSTLVFNVAKNDGLEKRMGKITILSGNLREEVMIYQEGAKPAIIVSQSEYIVPSVGETIAVEVKSNVDVAIEMPDADWIIENRTRGISTNTYYFDILQNETHNNRIAEIKFTNKSNNISEIVTITQMQKNTIVLAKDSYTIDNKGGNISIEVNHNVDFDFTIAEEWIVGIQTRGLTSTILNFAVEENTSYDNRENSIIFTSKDKSIEQVVKIYQAQSDALIISNKDIFVDAVGGEVTIELKTNIEFEVSNPNVYWLQAVSTRGLTSHTLNYIVEENTSYDSREAQIIVTDTKNNKSDAIIIKQDQKDVIIIAKDLYIVDSKGGQITIEIEANVDYVIDISNNWIKHITTRSVQNNTATFEIQQNTGKIDRQGLVKFVSQDGTISQTVYINQTCANGNTEDIENGDINEW